MDNIKRILVAVLSMLIAVVAWQLVGRGCGVEPEVGGEEEGDRELCIYLSDDDPDDFIIKDCILLKDFVD